MTATIYNGRGAPDAARTVSFDLPDGDYSGLALAIDLLGNRVAAGIGGDGRCTAIIPEEALRAIPCGTHTATLLLRGPDGREGVFATVSVRVSDIPGEASAYADVAALEPPGAVTAGALAEALAAIDAPASGATQRTLRETLSALVAALKGLGGGVAAALLLSGCGVAFAQTIPWERVPPDTPVDTNSLNAVSAGRVEVPAEAAARGVTAEDSHGCAHDSAVQIGVGAMAHVSAAAILDAPSNTVVRSVSVAVGPGADATDPNNPTKHQALAIGNQSRASAVNAIAIGSGVRHDDEDDMSGGNAYASGQQSTAIGYAAKATATKAVQIGEGVNDVQDSLKFGDVFVVRDGRVQAPGTDTNTVARMIREETEKGVMYGSTGVTNAVDEATGETNAWHYIRIEGVNESQGSDPALVVAVSADTNSDVAASFPLFPGSPNRRDIYSAATVDRKIAAATNGIAAVEWLSAWSWPDEWTLSIEAMGYTPAFSGYVPNKDIYAAVTAPGSDLPTAWAAYTVPETHDISSLVDMPDVSIYVEDPDGAVGAVTGNVAYASGKFGQFAFVAADTNGVERRAYIIAAPAPEGKTNELFAMEGENTERWIWTTNALARLNAVSTNAEDMVAHVQCRTAANRFAQNGTGTWMAPRALSRFGTGGRISADEWPSSYAWGGGIANRHWCLKENEDFFWPELRTNLWCYTVNCHESTTPKWNFRAGSAMAVAPHYIVSASHFGSWMWGPGQTWTDSPRFRFGPGTNDTVFCRSPRQIVANVSYPSGGKTDIEVCRVTNTIPLQCVAHFARESTLRALSPTMFEKCVGFTISSHQTVTPVCISPHGFTGSWSAMPVGETDYFKTYIPDETLLGKVPRLEHITHMFDSASPFFLVAPNGRVVPVGQVQTAGGRGTGGPTYFNDDILDAIDTAIRLDSGGTEGLSYWAFGDLWSGVGTNSVPEL